MKNDVMDESLQEHEMPNQFIRRHLRRMVIGLILVAMIYGAMSVVVPYQREKRIAAEVATLGGEVRWEETGASWIPQSVRCKLRFFGRLTCIAVRRKAVSSELLSELALFDKLSALFLINAQITDHGMQNLNITATTPEGRTMLRMALPNCKIEPEL